MNIARGEILHYIKGLLYASAMNSNYYQSSDFNVNYEFDILPAGRTLRTHEQLRIEDWKTYVKEMLSHWLFKHMPLNSSHGNWYAKDFLIAEIMRNLEKLFSKEVQVFESDATNILEGIKLIFEDTDAEYYIMIELNDSFVRNKQELVSNPES